jgi:hypothetical protein
MLLFRNSNALRILLLTSHHLIAFTWSHKVLSPSGQFGIDDQGIAEFRRYLLDSPDIPLYLLADLVEEDFRNETVPHVLGKDRRILHQRKLSQLFRTSEYRCALVQGREAQGRRDDRLLFCALTNNDRLAPWITSILENKIPLMGVSSTPILMEFLAKHMHFEQVPHLLLVTTHPPGGLRLTYLQNCHLKFSRLLALPDMTAGSLAEAVKTESRHTRQYLERLKLIPRDQPMEIHLFTSAETGADWDMNSLSIGNLLPICFHETGSIAAASGFDILPDAIGATAICLVHALLDRALPNSYGPKAVVRYHDIAQIHRIMNFAGIAVILLSLMAGIPPLITGLKDLAQARRLGNESKWLERQYQSLRQNFPSPPIPAEEMKNVVETVEAIRRQSFSPMTMMTLISQSLACCPEIQLKDFDWQEESAATPETVAATGARQGSGAGDRQAATRLVQAILDKKTAVTTVLSGAIDPFTGYRNAHDSIARLIAALEKTRGIQASALSMPMETRANSATKASLDGLAIIPEFSLKIEYRPAP